jgi:hypothetical protein
MTTPTLADIQRRVGVTADGKIGPQTLGAIAKALGMEARPERSMRDLGAFFAGVRKVTGPLKQMQVDTVSGLLASAAHWPLSWLAYGLATAWHEARFEPVEEIGKGRGKAYGKPGRYGQSQHGRGLVQLTWDDNYERADDELELGGRLLADFNLALDPDIATAILVRGMEEGWFTGKKLADYLPGERGTFKQFEQARRIINGTDKMSLIADHAIGFQDAGAGGGWA